MIKYQERLLNISNDSLIDVHTHSGGLDFSNFLRGKYPYCQDLTDLYFKGKSSSVSHQVVFPMPTSSYYDTFAYWEYGVFRPSGFCQFPFEVENSHLLKSISQMPFERGFFLPFLSFSLQDKVSEQEESILKLTMQSPHVWGFKFHTSTDQKSALQIEKESGFLDIAAELHRPFIIHTGLAPCSNPVNVVELASRHPNIVFCAAHFGSFSQVFANLLDEYPYDNLFFDTSGLVPLCNNIKASSPLGVLNLDYKNPISVFNYYADRFPQRILWGSDSPWYNSFDFNKAPLDTKLRTYSQESNIVSDSYKRQILNNTTRFLSGSPPKKYTLDSKEILHL